MRAERDGSKMVAVRLLRFDRSTRAAFTVPDPAFFRGPPVDARVVQGRIAYGVARNVALGGTCVVLGSSSAEECYARTVCRDAAAVPLALLLPRSAAWVARCLPACVSRLTEVTFVVHCSST